MEEESYGQVSHSYGKTTEAEKKWQGEFFFSSKEMELEWESN